MREPTDEVVGVGHDHDAAIARHLGKDRKTVRAYLNGRQAGVRQRTVADHFEPFADYVRQRLTDDPHLWASTLYDELLGLGYDRSYPSMTRAIRAQGLRPACEACRPTKDRAVAVIDEISRHQDIHVLEVAIRLKGRWRGHQAGQFAFVTFDAQEGPHPFTITSVWNGDGRLRFAIKALGDYTQTLPATLKVGDPVKVEGPYGQFNFIGNKPRQIWIAGGIGITPFVARMKKLARQPDGKIVDLFYSTARADDEIISRLRRDAQAAKVTLHVLKGGDTPLTVERITRVVPKWQSSDIWFCGPSGFGHDLRRDFRARRLPAEDFHQELFELR